MGILTRNVACTLQQHLSVMFFNCALPSLFRVTFGNYGRGWAIAVAISLAFWKGWDNVSLDARIHGFVAAKHELANIAALWNHAGTTPFSLFY